MSYPIGNENRNDGSAANDEKRSATNNESLPAASSSESHQSETVPTAKQNKSNSFYASCTFKVIGKGIELFVGLALVGVGYLQFTVYTRQAGIMETQTKLSEADERPWVKPKILWLNPLYIDNFSFSFGFQFTLENSGKYPAFWVTHQVALIPRTDTPQSVSFKDHDKLCNDTAGKQASGVDNITIFPNEAESGLGSTWGSPLQAFILEKPPSKRMFPVVNGCIVYKGATDVVHHTWFSYQVVRTAPPEKAAGWIDAVPETIPADQIGLQPGHYGRNTAD